MKSSDRRKLIMGCAIGGLGIWIGISRLAPGGGPDSAAAATSEADEFEIDPNAATRPALAPDVLAAQRELADAEWPANPFFRRAAGAAGGLQESENPVDQDERGLFVLNAIISGAAPRAMINGRVVTVGNRLDDGSVITAIDAFEITIEGPCGASVLRLPD